VPQLCSLASSAHGRHRQRQRAALAAVTVVASAAAAAKAARTAALVVAAGVAGPGSGRQAFQAYFGPGLLTSRLGQASAPNQRRSSVFFRAASVNVRRQAIGVAGEAVAEVYSVALGSMLALAAGLAAWTQPWADRGSRDSDIDNLTTGQASGGLAAIFLPVWLLCVAGDWLQGPYVYALYESYGLPREDIARLFVAGFGASMAFGTFVGSWVDQLGRKRGC
ncbi:unnamed protein product, partial [Polarella glacialis]